MCCTLNGKKCVGVYKSPIFFRTFCLCVENNRLTSNVSHHDGGKNPWPMKSTHEKFSYTTQHSQRSLRKYILVYSLIFDQLSWIIFNLCHRKRTGQIKQFSVEELYGDRSPEFQLTQNVDLNDYI